MSGDPFTGVRRICVDTVDARGYAGDDACGDAVLSVYVSDDGIDGACAEIVTYVEDDHNGEFGVMEMVTIGRAEYEADSDYWRADDYADIDYDYASAFAFETFEAAQAECLRLGNRDASFALYLRDPFGDLLNRPYPYLPERLFV